MNEGIKPHLRDFILYILVIALAIGIALFLFSKDNTKVTQTNQNTTTNTVQKENMKPSPAMEIDTAKKYQATLSTDKGEITIELFANETPITVNNFVTLSKKGFYNGTVFHRIVKNFMIQGGDPNGNGTGGPGYTFADEKITRDYKRGIVAMANRGKDTNGSQFFIMQKDTELPKQYVIFGQVTSGLDAVDLIADAPATDNGQGEQSKPVQPVKVNKVSITESQ